MAAYTGPFPTTITGATYTSVEVIDTSFTGNLSNAGTLQTTQTGISLVNSTITGAIVDSGVVVGLHGIEVVGTSAITAANVDISITGPTFVGGISNDGTITATAGTGISVKGVTKYTGGIANSRQISAFAIGISLDDDATFSGGIGNTGTVASSNATGIFIDDVTTYTGGVTNAGSISALAAGISLDAVTSFSGGNISNAGTITAKIGIDIEQSTITGAIVDSGAILATNVGIAVDSLSSITVTGSAIAVSGPTFSGGIANAGMLTGAGTGIGVAIGVRGAGTFSGGIVNSTSATISGRLAAIDVRSTSTFLGGITNNGVILRGLLNDIVAQSDAQFGSNSAGGGITNSGTLSVSDDGIFVENVTSFLAAISNSGTITALSGEGERGIFVTGVNQFGGSVSSGITNSGAIVMPRPTSIGIQVKNVGSFNGDIVNSTSGSIAAAIADITVQRVSTFAGNITNSGALSAPDVAGAYGIDVSNVAFFGTGSSGGQIVNTGAVTADVAILVNDVTSTFSGGITNSGTITGTGIDVTQVNVFVGGGIVNSASGVLNGEGIVVANVSTFAAAITNAGTITDGIGADLITAFGTSSAGGGIVNTGSVSAAGEVALNLNAIATFAGGITNAGGTIWGGATGIKLIRVTGFSGGITNSGTITGATLVGIFVEKGASFAGAIVNSAGGTITGAVAGIDVGSFAMFGSTSAGGGITNSGTITATGLAVTAAGINVSTVTTFAGNISNAGTIAGVDGIAIGAFAGVTFAAGSGIVNTGTITGTAVGIGLSAFESDVSVFDSGTISGGTDAVQFDGTGNTFTLGPGYAITGNVVGTGSDTFQLGGSGNGSFDLDNLGTQYTGFTTFNVVGATWVATGASTQNWTISSGTLQLGNGGSGAGAGSITGNVTDDSTFAIDRSDAYTFASVISGTGVFEQLGSGTTILTAADDYGGGTDIEAGTLELGAGGSVTGNVLFGSDTATLQFDTGTSQLGGDIVGAVPGDAIDLHFQAFASGDHAVWQQTGGTGTLTLETSGGSTLATLTLSGSYQTANFTVTHDNQGDALIELVPVGPVVATGNPSATYAAGSSPVTLDSGLIVSDDESATLDSATVAITGGAFAGDVLSANTAGTAITASYNSATETLTLSGMDTLADYQAVLRRVAFASTSPFPTDSGADPSRAVSWTANDGTLSSTSMSTTLNVTGPNQPPPAGTTALLIMSNPSNGDYEIYDIGGDALLAAYSLGQVGSPWTFSGLGDFQGSDNDDMLLRNTSTGAFEAYYISNNNITNAALVGTVGTNWNFAGVGDFDGASSLSELMLRNASSGSFELYEVVGGGVLSGNSVAPVGNNFQVIGFGNFSEPSETQMIMQDHANDSSAGQLELYTYQSSTGSLAGIDVGKVGTNVTIVGCADLLGNGDTQMMMRQNTGEFWLYTYNPSSNVLSGISVGAVGTDWQVVGFGPLNTAGQDDMLLQNSSGAFEVYNYNATTNSLSGTPMGEVGAPWVVDGIAADLPGSAAASTAQLVQAMASFGAAGASTSGPIPVTNEPSQQWLLTTPHA